MKIISFGTSKPEAWNKLCRCDSVSVNDTFLSSYRRPPERRRRLDPGGS
jgi:hypothetical protein